MKYAFGDLVYYTSPETGTKTKCVFIRGTEENAFVMFKIASQVAKVGYENIAKVG